MDNLSKRGRVVAFYNRKGGVGKTTLSGNFAALMAKKGRVSGSKVLYLDFDTQSNSSGCFLGFSDEYLKQDPGTYPNLLSMVGVHIPSIDISKMPVLSLVQKANLNLYTIAQHKEMELLFSKAYGEDYDIFTEPFKELRKEYDWIILDLPCAQDTTTRSALAASDYLIMPLGASRESTQYLPEFMTEHLPIIKAYNENLVFLGMVHNLADRYTANLYDHEYKNKSKEFGVYLYKAKIRSSVGLRDINSDDEKSLKARSKMNRCVVACDNFIFKTYPKAFQDFEDFASETLSLIKKAEKKGDK